MTRGVAQGLAGEVWGGGGEEGGGEAGVGAGGGGGRGGGRGRGEEACTRSGAPPPRGGRVWSMGGGRCPDHQRQAGRGGAEGGRSRGVRGARPRTWRGGRSRSQGLVCRWG